MKHRFFLPCILAAALFLPSESPAAFRKVLAEMFTSTTCGPCYAADVFYFDTWLPTYGGADQVITLAYHVWWPAPGNDPLYLANPTPVQEREAFYRPAGVSYAPRMLVDGFVDAGFQYSTWPGAIEPRFLDTSPIAIVLTGNRDGSTLTMTASITAEQPVNSAAWRVHWAVVESGLSVPQFNGSTYVPFTHRSVHRGMYPDGNGSPIAITQGQTVDVQRTLTLEAGWVPENCNVIVFVQNTTDKKVQNAEIVNVADLVAGAGENPAELPAAFALGQSYPNPFNPRASFDIHIARQTHTTVTVHDVLGRRVATLVDEVRAPGVYTVAFDGAGLPSGTYFYRLTAGGYTGTRRMLLTK